MSPRSALRHVAVSIVALAAAPGRAAPPHATLSPGWSVEAEAQGDLNADGLDDAVVILSKDVDTPAKSKVLLRVYFGQRDGTYALAAENSKGLCAHCGGVLGEPVPYSVSVERGVLHLEMSGGSRERWGLVTKWRFRRGAFFLIGVTADTFDSAAAVGDVESIVRDANVSTLKMEMTTKTVVSLGNDGDPVTRASTRSCAIAPSYKALRLEALGDRFSSPECRP
jgi:hypothetical protein